MSELRRIIRKVNQYVFLVAKKPDVIKKNLDYYYNDFAELREDFKRCTNKNLSLFQHWCKVNAETFDFYGQNIFLILKNRIKMSIAGYHMNKLSYNLSMLDILSNNIDTISARLEQFKTFHDLNKGLH